MPRLRAAIFDMDGLLIDSEPFWRTSHVNVLATHGAVITEDDVRIMAGRRTDEVVEHWRATYNLKVSAKDLENAIVNLVLENIRLYGLELPGVRHILSILEKHGTLLALASSSSPEIIEAVIAKLELTKRFSVIYSAKHEQYGKPHPGVFVTTAHRLGVDASECVVLEDALNGVRAAKAAGMKCIAVPEKINLDVAEFKNEADLVVPSLNDLDWATITKLFS